jgi:hypothetical protein
LLFLFVTDGFVLLDGVILSEAVEASLPRTPIPPGTALLSVAVAVDLAPAVFLSLLSPLTRANVPQKHERRRPQRAAPPISLYTSIISHRNS